MENIPVGYDKVAIFSYVMVNNGHGHRSSVEQRLESTAITISVEGANIVADVATDEGIIPVLGRIIGYVLGDIITWLIGIVGDAIEELVKEGCDGYLASGYHAYSGAELCNSSWVGTNINMGMPVQKFLGFIPGILCSLHRSQYNLDWYILH